MVVDEKEGIRLEKCLMDLLKDDTAFGDADKKHMNLDHMITWVLQLSALSFQAHITPLKPNRQCS